jgi:hypothetical protein
MKYPFVVGTIAEKRKGGEDLAPNPHHHPAREEVIVSPKGATLPVRVLPRKVVDKKSEDQELIDRAKAEMAKLLASVPKSKKVPSNRISGMIKVAEDEPAPVPTNYNDILKMLQGLK